MKTTNRGGALLAVLWLSAALTAIAFSVASTVRSETERASTDSESLRTYYLASGAVERALLWREWGRDRKTPNDPVAPLYFEFPSGDARVEMIPETSKLNVNTSSPDELAALLAAIGAPPDTASAIAAGIVDWRTALPPEETTAFDQYYLSLGSSFRARHASFEEIEELLLIRGMTPELFYGGYWRGPAGQLIAHAALRDCVSVYGSPNSGYDVNTVTPAVLSALGLAPEQVHAVVEMRRAAPIRSMDQLGLIGEAPGLSRLRVGGGAFWTVRATARLRLQNGQYSDLRRTVAAMVRDNGPEEPRRFFVMRWYDNMPMEGAVR